MEKRYWDGEGKYKKEYERVNLYIPKMGKAGEPAAEAVRQAANVYYDFYNNGLCNTDEERWIALAAALETAGITGVDLDPEVGWETEEEFEAAMDQIIQQAYHILEG